MESATIMMLSEHQISELHRLMAIQMAKIENIGVVIESGSIIIEYRGGIYDYESHSKTISIPRKKPR